MRKWAMLVLAVMLILVGCDSNLVHMKTDMPKAMPADFGFDVKFGYGKANEINTYDATITKDLVAAGTAKTDLKLSEDEMRAIYAQMRAIDMMGKKKLVGTGSCDHDPHTEDYWKVTVAGKTKFMNWSDCDMTNDAQQLSELRQSIQKLVASKDAYKKLPEANGAYS